MERYEGIKPFVKKYIVKSKSRNEYERQVSQARCQNAVLIIWTFSWIKFLTKNIRF
jgi:hypothetical protein